MMRRPMMHRLALAIRPTRLACVRCVLAGVGLHPGVSHGDPAPVLLDSLEITPATLWWDEEGRMALCGCGWRAVPAALLASALPSP